MSANFSSLTLFSYLDSYLNMKIKELFEALADENRRKILDLLKRKDLSVGDIGEHLPISGASLSHHLNKLKSADLVKTTRKGQTIIYSIHTSVFEDFSAYAIKFFEIGVKSEKSSKKQLA